MTPTVERGSVDGIPVLRADSAHGRHTAGLVFRVGRYDEPLASAGVTHLVEHLALHEQPSALCEWNAEVTGRFTTFLVDSSDPADVASFIEAICRGLAGDGRPRLEKERLILRTEAAGRGSGGTMAACLAERYGAAGPGLLAYEELGLHRLSWSEIEAWRARWFTAGNAVLWVAGQVPDGLRIPLPPGPRPVTDPPRPLDLRLPGYTIAGQRGVGISMVGRRSFAATAAVDVMQRRLTQVLRHEHGLTYNVLSYGDTVSAGESHVWLAADALPEQLAAAAHLGLSALEEMARAGCAEEEADDYARRAREAHASPAAAVGALRAQARDLLDGRPVLAAEQVVSEAAAVTPEAVAGAASALLASAIVAVPQAVPAVSDRMPQLPRWSAGSVRGRRVPGGRPGTTLTLGDRGVMLTVGPQRQVTVEFDQVAALVRWRDGERTVIGQDGFALALHPADWPDGGPALAAIDASVRPDLVVDVDAPGPGGGRAAQADGRHQPSAPAALTGLRHAGPDPAAGHRLTDPVAAGGPTAPAGGGPGIWPSRALWALLLLCWVLGLLTMLGGDRRGWAFLAVAAGGALWRAAPRVYRTYRPAAAPPPARGWGFRVVRAVFVIWTVLGALDWTAGGEAAAGLVVTGVASLAGQVVIADFLRRMAAR